MSETTKILEKLDTLSSQEIKRYLIEELTRKKLGLVWEADLIERDEALNSNLVFPKLDIELSRLEETSASGNLIIEGDNFDSLRLLRATHRGKIRVIYIDPPYNTGNKDWVYNDNFVKKDDRWKHSKWLEFLYQRLTLARDLLTPDGVILISINDENRAKLELLMDEVMPGRRVGSFVWRTKDTGNDAGTRLSQVHEHVLVYGNKDFKFLGRPVDKEKYKNKDNDPRGDWRPQPLTKAHSYKERENTYYPIQNPQTGYWYPCDPDNVWRFASEKEMLSRLGYPELVEVAKSKLRSETMEAMIAQKLIYFPPCQPGEVMLFNTLEELTQAIKDGKGPVSPKKKTPLLRLDLPDLEFWVGKAIAPGRPSRKDHWLSKPEEDRIAPVSSWVSGINEDIPEEDIELDILRATRGGVANDEIKKIFGSKVFNHPKPTSLLKGILGQASHHNDIILDFFAGSGTTAQAVVELNAQDGGNRKFIMCSNTEASKKEPDKNLCRDVCVERVRRVMSSYGRSDDVSDGFAYLTLDLIEDADLMFDAMPKHAFNLVSMRETGQVRPVGDDEPVWVVSEDDGIATVVCRKVNNETVAFLKGMGLQRLTVYSPRPDTIKDALEGKLAVSSHSIEEALRWAQVGNHGETRFSEERE